MYTIIKPESRNRLVSIDQALVESGFRVVSKHPIYSWTRLAERLYGNQSKSDLKFGPELNAYLWLTSHFFGDNALAFLLKREGRLEENLTTLGEMKKRFRTAAYEEDKSVQLLLNLDNVPIGDTSEMGLTGRIEVSGTPFRTPQHNGRWDYFYFKYLHTPDHDAYEREMEILREGRIFDHNVSEREWRLMKKLGTLVPLGDEK